MPIAFECDCGYRLRAADEKAGRKIRCPECSAVLVVPNSSSSGNSIPRKKSPRQPNRAEAMQGELPPSRSANRTISQKPGAKKTMTNRQRAIILILVAVIFTVAEFARHQSQARTTGDTNTAGNISLSNLAVDEASKPAALSPEQETLTFLLSACNRQSSPAEWATRVTIKVSNELREGLRDELVAKSGAKRSSTMYSTGVLIVDLDVPDVAELASKIDFGHVLKSDALTKTIFVDASTASDPDTATAP